MTGADIYAVKDRWYDLEIEGLMASGAAAVEIEARQSELEDQLLAAAEETGLQPFAPAADWLTDRPTPPRDTRILIVGAGVSAIAMGARLRERGFDDFEILEKSNELGGTWNHNRYPGIACDVASYFYQFSFFKNAFWSGNFPKGDEIRRYLAAVAEHYDLLSKIHFQEQVVECVFDSGWRVTTASGRVYEADVLVAATGFLHFPRKPDLAGAEAFRGEVLHSSEVTPETTFDGRRVGVVGTASSSVQIVSAVADRVAKLSVFQRTPQWIFAAPKKTYTAKRGQMLSLYPDLIDRIYEHYFIFYADGIGRAVVGDRKALSRYEVLCQASLDTVRDPELRQKLTPPDPVLCKRLVFSDTFYRTLEKPSVELVTAPISQLETEGVRTADGVLHPLDLVVLATGFESHTYCQRLNISVKGGPTLDELWADGPRSFESVAVASVPNMFILGGPYSTIGNLSTMTQAELQVHYIVDLLEQLLATGANTFAPRKAVEDAFVQEMREAVSKTVWVSGCKSWYLDEKGRVDIWSKTAREYVNLLQEKPDISNYEMAR